MEVTSEYMAKTAEAMAAAGYELTTQHDEKKRDDEKVFDRVRYVLKRSPNEHFELEALTYPDGTESFFVAIVRYHAMETFSFPLDSWKLWPDRVEFKYYTHPETGMGLTFKLWFSNEPG